MKLILTICLVLIIQISFGQFVGTPYIIKKAAEAPDEPTIGTAKGGDTEATIAFTAPTNNGGASITSFMVTSNPDGITANGTLSPIVITGLTNDRSYTFTVTATNSGGTSSPSAASSSVTPYSIPTVTSSTGKIWMDRNLGASQIATNKSDANSYGDLYQWGRAADGHQIRNSSIISTQSSTDQPAHSHFIKNDVDWHSPGNTNLWQGVDGVNNPCPSGFRLPTVGEWEAERKKYNITSADGAWASFLKLPMAGYRINSTGSLNNSSIGLYSSSTFKAGGTVQHVEFSTNYFSTIKSAVSRARGLSVRCIKN